VKQPNWWVVAMAATAGVFAGITLNCIYTTCSVTDADAQTSPASDLVASDYGTLDKYVGDLNPRNSLFYLPFDNIMNRNPKAIQAARHVLSFFDDDDVSQLHTARELYAILEQEDNFGGEYPTLDWVAQYLAESPDNRSNLLQLPEERRMLAFLEPNNYKRLREYLRQKHGLGRVRQISELRFIDEVIRFSSPRRNAWENSDALVEAIGIKPGQKISDIGAGSGYFSLRFSEEVGDKGMVFAVEMNHHHIAYMQEIITSEQIKNLRTIHSNGTEVGSDTGALDHVFLCSTYQVLYAAVRPEIRAAFIANVKNALKPDGLLHIADNEAIVTEGLPYRGISIAPELIVGQLESWGFRLKTKHQFIPQRYMLTFEVAD